MTKEEIERLEALCAAATPGPWESYSDEGPVWLPEGTEVHGRAVGWTYSVCADDPAHRHHACVAAAMGRRDGDEQMRANAALIAAAREALPALLAEVRRLAAERDAAVAQERERCALVCEALAAREHKAGVDACMDRCGLESVARYRDREDAAIDCAAAIRLLRPYVEGETL